VLSLVLTQPFFDPQVFNANAPRVKMCASAGGRIDALSTFPDHQCVAHGRFAYMPEFYLKK